MISDLYTPIHNEVLEKMAHQNLSAYQWRVMMIVWRRTYGLRRQKVTKLSHSYLSTATGISRENINRTLQALKKKNMIFAENGLVGFNKHFDDMLPSLQTESLQTESLQTETALSTDSILPSLQTPNIERLKKDNKERPQEKKILPPLNSSPLGGVSTQTQTSYSNRLESRRIFVEKIRKAVTPIIENKFNKAAACTFQNDMLGVEAVKANWTEQEHELYKAWVHYKTFYGN